MHFSASSFMAPDLHQLSAFVQKIYFFDEILENLHHILCKFSIMIITATPSGAIWDEFIGQHQHHSIKEAAYLMPN